MFCNLRKGLCHPLGEEHQGKSKVTEEFKAELIFSCFGSLPAVGIILGKEVNSISSLVAASGAGTLPVILVDIQADT